MGLSDDNEMLVYKYPSPTTSPSTTFDKNWRGGIFPHWFCLEDNGTTITLSTSPNGVKWQELLSEARGTYFTTGPDECGFYGNANTGAYDTGLILVHWSEQ